MGRLECPQSGARCAVYYSIPSLKPRINLRPAPLSLSIASCSAAMATGDVAGGGKREECHATQAGSTEGEANAVATERFAACPTPSPPPSARRAAVSRVEPDRAFVGFFLSARSPSS
jgi:hypothetical protein